MSHRDLEGVIGTCLSHGDAKAGGDTQLWADALHYLAGLEVRGAQGGSRQEVVVLAAGAGGDTQLWADALHYLAGLEVRGVGGRGGDKQV